MRFLGKDTTVLAGHGFDEKGPYLLISDIEKEAQHRFSVRNKTFTMKRLPERYCVGRFDLLTHRKSVCPLRVELLPSEKDGMCPACKEATGFNPSFYYAEAVSPQQRVYNETPHYVYLAYFSKQHIKRAFHRKREVLSVCWSRERERLVLLDVSPMRMKLAIWRLRCVLSRRFWKPCVRR